MNTSCGCEKDNPFEKFFKQNKVKGKLKDEIYFSAMFLYGKEEHSKNIFKFLNKNKEKFLNLKKEKNNV